jgi:hypothetical protein
MNEKGKKKRKYITAPRFERGTSSENVQVVNDAS